MADPLPSTLSVAPSRFVARLSAGDLNDITPSAAQSLMFDGVFISTAVLAGDDKVLIQDTDDSDILKTVTAQSIAELIGAGDVQGPAVAVDEALCRFDLTTGKLIQNSLILVDDAGAMTGLTGVDVTGDITVSGNVDGRDLSVDGAKLDLIADNADVTAFTNVNAALVTPDADILVNSALGDFNFVVGGDTNANLLMVDAGLDAVGIGAAAVTGSILTLNTTTSPLEFIESVFNAGLTVPAGTISGFLRVEIGGNILFINAYSVIPS